LDLSPTSSPQRKRRPPQLSELNTHGLNFVLLCFFFVTIIVSGSATLDFHSSPKRNFSNVSASDLVSIGCCFIVIVDDLVSAKSSSSNSCFSFQPRLDLSFVATATH
jgi:hypothetical protein